jgi:hypothetical protein
LTADESRTLTTVTRELAVLFVVAVVSGLLAVSGTASSPSRGVPAEAAFQLADGSVGCLFTGRRLACRSQSMRHAAILEADGSSSSDDSPVAWDADTTVLRPSESWWHGEFSCVARAGVVCTTSAGGTLAVSAGR